MLLPRFSIRWILIFTTTLSVLFVVVRQAFLQQHWAMAVSATLAFSIVIFLIYGAMFLAAYALARATRTLQPPKAPANPFIVEGEFPPQLVPKRAFGGEDK